MSDEKKYEILPGVELPDMKSINEAASDFSVSGVNDIKIKSPQPIYTPAGEAADAATAAELAALQSLGDEVAANEARAAAESRARMDAIMATAVKQPESIVDLLNYNRDKVSEEVIKQKEEEMRKAQELQDALAQKEREREERRQMQQRLLEEARERAAAVREAEKRGIKPDESLIDSMKTDDVEEKKTEAAPEQPAKEAVKEAVKEPEKQPGNKPEDKPAEAAPEAKKPEQQQKKAPEAPVRKNPLAPQEPVKPSIATPEETFHNFSEFLDEDK
ncbi:MAG: hypothetical protein K6F03_03535 [Saccharofermentans sp.]|nr:hypothetical protein [Saccharofermentans sp.]